MGLNRCLSSHTYKVYNLNHSHSPAITQLHIASGAWPGALGIMAIDNMSKMIPPPISWRWPEGNGVDNILTAGSKETVLSQPQLLFPKPGPQLLHPTFRHKNVFRR